MKEGLTKSPLDWPGVHAAGPLVHSEPLEGYWWNRRKEWSAMNRGLDVGRYDFATRYRVHFSQLPAFRHLSAEAYQDKVAGLICEIVEEGEERRDGNPAAGVERILSQNPYEPPTRKTKRSTKPMFHVASKQARDELRRELAGFLARYWEASEALRDGNLKAASWFPGGSYSPALAFVGAPRPARPLPPPTRLITTLESGRVERGDVPVIEILPMDYVTDATVTDGSSGVDGRARGQPP